MTPIPNHPMDADIDCSVARVFRPKSMLVGVFDGDAPAS